MLDRRTWLPVAWCLTWVFTMWHCSCSEDTPPVRSTDDVEWDETEVLPDGDVRDSQDVPVDAAEDVSVDEELLDVELEMMDGEEIEEIEEIVECECAEDEVCVSNHSVTNECFPRDCLDEQCDANQVCYDGSCVGVLCAGVWCSDEFMVCRGGICIQEDCQSPDVSCRPGYECVDNQCIKTCEQQSECGGFACVDGFCVPCEDDFACELGTLCFDGACVPPCWEDPGICPSDHICHPETGRCIERCTADNACGEEQMCDFDTGQCVPFACHEPGSVEECDDGRICVQHRCVLVSPQFYGGLSGGGGMGMTIRHMGTFICAPISMVGLRSESDRHVLYTGMTQAIWQE